MLVGVNGLFLSHPYTGSGLYLRYLIQAMGEVCSGVDLRLYVPDAGGALHIDGAECEIRRVPVPRWLSNHWAKTFFELVAFPTAALEDGCDIIHAPYFAPPVVGASSAVVTIHDVIPLLLPSYRRGALAHVYYLVVACAARRIARIIADSEWSRRDIVQRLMMKAGNVDVVYLAPAFGGRIQPERWDRSVLHRYGLPNKYVLYFGGFDSRKGVQYLLEAYVDLLHSGVEVPPLVMAGNLPDRSSATLPDPRHLIEAMGLMQHVRLPGRIDEVDKAVVFGAASAFAYPSLYEGFGLPPLEAMACGVPVVTTRASSLPEICGEAALLVRPADARALSEGVAQVLGDANLRARLRERGPLRASQFSWEKTARQTLGVYVRASGSASMV